MKHSEFWTTAATAVPVFLFLVLALFFIFTKSIDLATYPQDQGVVLSFPENDLAEIASPNMPASMRVGVGFVYKSVETIIKTLSALVVNDPASAPLYPGRGWGTHSSFKPGHITYVIVPLLSSVAWKLVALSAICLLAFTAYSTMASRSVFIVIVMTSLVGWPDLVLNSYYSFMRLFFDWPISPYLFTHPVAPYDFGAVCFLNFLILYLIKVEDVRLWHVVLLAGAGQLIFEFLGFVTGVSIFLWTIWRNSQDGRRNWFLGFKRLGAAGVVSLTILGVLVAMIYHLDNSVFEQYEKSVLIQDTSPGSQPFNNMWNFVDPKFTLSVFITAFIFPIVFGMVFGAAMAALASSRATDLITHMFRAAAVVAAAFCLALIIGLPISGYLSELGRQGLGGVTVFFAATALGTELLVHRWIRGT